jgi:hypothetical protein
MKYVLFWLLLQGDNGGKLSFGEEARYPALFFIIVCAAILITVLVVAIDDIRKGNTGSGSGGGYDLGISLTTKGKEENK